MKSPVPTQIKLIILIVIAVSVSSLSYSADEQVVLREPFNNLDKWEPLYFKKIKKHTMYSVMHDDESSYLKAESNASASGLVFKETFNPYEYPKVRWKWKVEHVYKHGDARTREGDDYPIRIYIMFHYDPDKASFGKKLKYGLAKKIYGTYPPDSTLNYIWANREHEEDIITNSYAKEAKMIILQAGMKNQNVWIQQQVNILEDYRRAFGKDPPEEAQIAIMNDSDNTGESAVSFVDFIEVYK